jgi:hypothetical protein
MFKLGKIVEKLPQNATILFWASLPYILEMGRGQTLKTRIFN